MKKVSFNSVRHYKKLVKHVDYVFSAKPSPKNFKRSDDIDFFGDS